LLRGHEFALVMVSPLSRAHETCLIAGHRGRYGIDEDLMEWDYGEYEGLTTAEIAFARLVGRFGAMV